MAFLTPPTWLENSSAHNAVDYRTMLGSVLGAGLGGVAASGDLKVSQKSGTANMSVDVAAGGIFIPSTRSTAQGTYHAYNDATVNVALSASDPTNPRIDRILVQVRDEAQDPALTQNDVRLLVVQGTAAASPVAPTVTVDDYVEIAQVTVPAAASSITDADISDSREASPAWAAPRGVLASVYQTGGQVLSTGAAAETVSSLTLSNVAVDEGRRLKVSMQGGFGITGTGPIDLLVSVYRGSTNLATGEIEDLDTNGTSTTSAMAIDVPGAGTYEFTVRVAQSGAVTKRMRGDAYPVTFLVEDIGGVLA